MPSVSASQQRFFGRLLSHPEEAKNRGLSRETVREFAATPTKGLPYRIRPASKVPVKHKNRKFYGEK